MIGTEYYGKYHYEVFGSESNTGGSGRLWLCQFRSSYLFMELVENEKEAADHDVENPRIPLLNSLRQKMTRWPLLSNKPCIYRAPKQLIINNESAYTPKVVSIGPFHYGGTGLELMEEYKERFFGDFLRRTNVRLEDYVVFTTEREARLRHCYAHTIDYESDKLLGIIMVDAAFVIELLLRNFVEEEGKSCRIFDRPYLIMNIASDMMLLENQLPMFLLQDLFNFAKIKTKSSYETSRRRVKDVSFLELVCEFINFKSDIGVKNYDLEKVMTEEPEHFLDCLRICHLSSMEKTLVNKEMKNIWVPTVTQLHQAGVQFARSSSDHLLDMEFKNGVLKIPHIFIGNSTEVIYRNLLAFEQCHYIDELFFTHYFSFMDRLIDSEKDIDLLVRNGIMENVLGDNDQAAGVFNSLAQHLTMSNEFYFADLSEQLGAFYKTPWHRWKAILKQDYFNTPWAGISVLAAGLLLFLATIQAVFSILSYVVAT